MVNCYVPINTESIDGDVTPFLDHMKKLLPVESDRDILLAYLAACVQYKGIKFQWAPLIQGCEGNGKTLFTRCVAHAVGHRYTHLPNAQELGGGGTKFNSWIEHKLLVGIEEIRVADKREIADALKPLITNDRIEIQGKGSNQYTGDNRANFILNSNHKDAVIKHRGDRRYSVFFTAQQSPEDLYGAGMVRADLVTPSDYFPKLYDWLNHGGYAAVTHYLREYRIPEHYNPATLCVRAPLTSSTTEAVELSMGPVEQEILEQVEQGAPGFAGGWISSVALSKLIQSRGDMRKISHSRRLAMLETLGYIPHPGLPGGRVSRSIPCDGGGRPRLYVKPGAIQCNLDTADGIANAYEKAQQNAMLNINPGIDKIDNKS